MTVRNLKQIKSKEDLDLDNDFEDFMRSTKKRQDEGKGIDIDIDKIRRNVDKTLEKEHEKELLRLNKLKKANEARMNDIRMDIDEEENNVSSKSTIHRNKTKFSDINSKSENDRFIKKVNDNNMVTTDDDTTRKEVTDIQNDIFIEIDKIERMVEEDEIPEKGIDILKLQIDIKEYVKFYRKNISTHNFKNNLRVDEHGMNIFNHILHLFGQPLINSETKLYEAYKKIKPMLSAQFRYIKKND